MRYLDQNSDRLCGAVFRPIYRRASAVGPEGNVIACSECLVEYTPAHTISGTKRRTLTLIMRGEDFGSPFAAWADQDGTFTLLDATSNGIIHVTPDQQLPTGLTFHPDGETAVFAGLFLAGNTGKPTGDTVSFTVVDKKDQVPEPPTVLLLGLAISGLALFRIQKRKAA